MVEQGENLTKEGLKKIYHELNELYFEDSLQVEATSATNNLYAAFM